MKKNLIIILMFAVCMDLLAQNNDTNALQFDLYKYLDAKNNKKIIETIDKLLVLKHSERAALYTIKGMSHTNLNEDDAAIDAYLQAYKLDTLNKGVMELLGSQYFERGNENYKISEKTEVKTEKTESLQKALSDFKNSLLYYEKFSKYENSETIDKYKRYVKIKISDVEYQIIQINKIRKIEIVCDQPKTLPIDNTGGWSVTKRNVYYSNDIPLLTADDNYCIFSHENKIAIRTIKNEEVNTFDFNAEKLSILPDKTELIFITKDKSVYSILQPFTKNSKITKLLCNELPLDITGIEYMNKSTLLVYTKKHVSIYKIANLKLQIIRKLILYSDDTRLKYRNNKLLYNNGNEIEIIDLGAAKTTATIKPKISEDIKKNYKFYFKTGNDADLNTSIFSPFFITDEVVGLYSPYYVSTSYYNIQTGKLLNTELLSLYMIYGVDYVDFENIGEYIVANRSTGDMMPCEDILCVYKFDKTNNELIKVFSAEHVGCGMKEEDYQDFFMKWVNHPFTPGISTIVKLNNNSFSINNAHDDNMGLMGISAAKRNYAIYTITKQ